LDSSGYLTKEAWNIIGLRHHHGLNIPLFSLHSKKSSGIGEFLDLLPIIDWCKEIGFDVIQLLPLNDTGFESSPYNALSSLALHPIYLSLWALPYLDQFKELKDELLIFRKYAPLQRIPYESILLKKLHFLKLYFYKTFPFIENSSHFQTFCKHNSWLHHYALFKVLKEKTDHKSCFSWDRSLIESLSQTDQNQMQFYIFLQYLAFEQLQSVKQYANSKQIFLKGDIPMLISPESHDVWLHQKEFSLDFTAGAPPDMFSLHGQNWGFPLYQWNEIESNHYAWWKARLSTASQFYNLYRVDHIIGFFRIWGIPKGFCAQDGAYIPKDADKAKIQGEKILRALISFTKMLPIGEDLGLDVDLARSSMKRMGIPGTKIPRWERYYRTTKGFIPYTEYPPLSLTTLSTHDSETLEEWWIHEPKDAQDFCYAHSYEYQEKLNPKIREQILRGAHQSASFFHINLLNEYLPLFPELAWRNPKEERINFPGTILPSNWSYRFRPSVEEITSHVSLASLMRSFSSPPLF
jgi:4-alpha-glucanotransferase